MALTNPGLRDRIVDSNFGGHQELGSIVDIRMKAEKTGKIDELDLSENVSYLFERITIPGTAYRTLGVMEDIKRDCDCGDIKGAIKKATWYTEKTGMDLDTEDEDDLAGISLDDEGLPRNSAILFNATVYELYKMGRMNGGAYMRK